MKDQNLTKFEIIQQTTHVEQAATLIMSLLLNLEQVFIIYDEFKLGSVDKRQSLNFDNVIVVKFVNVHTL